MPTRIDILAEKATRGDLTQKEQAIYKWITANFGALSKIAQECGVSTAHTHYVAMGKRRSKDLRIERALKDLGCPIIAKIN